MAQPPASIPLLPFLALVPLLVAVERAGSGREAAWAGLLFGVAYWGVLLVWVPLEVGPLFGWAYAGYPAQVGLLSGLAALMAWMVFALGRRGRLPPALTLPLAWVGMEWFKAHFPLGLAFPWMGLAVTLTPWPEFLGPAAWVGEGGVAFWLAAVNGWVGGLILARGARGRGPGPLRPGGAGASLGSPGGLRRGPSAGLLAAVVLALLPGALGVLRARGLTLEPGPEVLLVGTSVPAGFRVDPEASTEASLKEVEGAVREFLGGSVAFLDVAAQLPSGPETLPGGPESLPGGPESLPGGPESLPGGSDPPPHPQDPVELLVLPEATVGVPLDGPSGRVARHRLGALSRALGAPVLLGARGSGRPDPLPTNSAFLLGPHGEILARYDKVRLVPGMEWGGYEPGPTSGSALPTPAGSVAPLICYESIFGGLARRHRRAGGEILANLTSDVWFGEGGWVGSVFLPQHPAHMVLRAVENGLPVLRVANGGYTGALDPLGRQVGEALSPGPGHLRVTVPEWGGRTVFSRTGDLAGPLALAATSILLGLSYLRRVGPLPETGPGSGPTA